jgi:hypothetical protein
MSPVFRNGSLFRQLIVPMLAVGIIGASAIIASAFVLQNSVKALGEMYSASGDRLETLQELDKDIANVRALSLRHLASESAQDMNQIRTDLDSVEQRIKLSLPGISRPDLHARQSRAPGVQQDAKPQRRARKLPVGHRQGHRTQRGVRERVRIQWLTRTENQHLPEHPGSCNP